jgi:hypothetical protein
MRAWTDAVAAEAEAEEDLLIFSALAILRVRSMGASSNLGNLDKRESSRQSRLDVVAAGG